MQKIHVSDQYAANTVSVRHEFADMSKPIIETALQHAKFSKISQQNNSTHGVSLSEQPVTGLLVLRAQQDKSGLQAALNSTLNLDLPEILGSNAASVGAAFDSPCVRWVAPDEWMLSCPVQDAFNNEHNLRVALGDQSVAIVNVTGGYTVLRLTGLHANDVLKKSTAYDVHPTNFTAGKVVNTILAKAQVTLRCIDNNDYEIIVRRSFADYLWHWIQVAASEYGLSIVTES